MASLAIDWLVPLYYSCVMYCTLYQSCDSHKHIKLEQLRSAIKCHSVPVGVPLRVEMSNWSRTWRQCSRCSVFWSYDPKSQSRGQSENLQLPLFHTASPHHTRSVKKICWSAALHRTTEELVETRTGDCRIGRKQNALKHLKCNILSLKSKRE